MQCLVDPSNQQISPPRCSQESLQDYRGYGRWPCVQSYPLLNLGHMRSNARSLQRVGAVPLPTKSTSRMCNSLFGAGATLRMTSEMERLQRVSRAGIKTIKTGAPLISAENGQSSHSNGIRIFLSATDHETRPCKGNLQSAGRTSP